MVYSTVSSIGSADISYPVSGNVISSRPKNLTAIDEVNFSNKTHTDKKKHTGLWILGGIVLATTLGLVFRKNIGQFLKKGKSVEKSLTCSEEKTISKSSEKSRSGSGGKTISKSSEKSRSSSERKTISNLTTEVKSAQEYKDIFIKIRHLEGQDFSSRTFELIMEHLGYKDCPAKFIYKTNDEITTSFLPINATIALSKRGRSKAETFGSIRHEAEHFIQACDIIRTEGLGVEAFLRSQVASKIKSLQIYKEVCKREFGKTFEEFSADELNNLKQKCYNDYMRSFNRDVYDRVITVKGKIKAGTAEAKRSEEYLVAQSEQIGTGDILKKTSEECTQADVDILNQYYFGNLLEKNAYLQGDKARDEYRAFESALNL